MTAANELMYGMSGKSEDGLVGDTAYVMKILWSMYMSQVNML